jgi:hypothetical protein
MQVNAQSRTSQIGDSLLESKSIRHSSIAEVFQKVEQGVKTNTLGTLGGEYAFIVSITIGAGEHGLYSLNQSKAILEGYFSERHTISFEFSKIQETAPSPYATGRFIFIQKGVQKSAQVYVSLTQQDSRWVISQFNIY